VLVCLPCFSLAATYSVLTINTLLNVPYINTGEPLLLNNLGEVAGTYVGPPTSSGLSTHGFRTQPNTPFNAATDDVGQVAQPPDGSGFFAVVDGMNNLGELVGQSTSLQGEVSFRTDSSGKISPATDNLGTIGASFINDRGQIVGSVNATAFRTQPNQPYNPSTDNLGNYHVYGLNNRGQVLGDTGTPNTLFLTAPDGPVVLPTDSLNPNFDGRALNDLGQVAGGILPSHDIFLTSPNQPASGGTDCGVSNAFGLPDLNNNGVFVGTIGVDRQGQTSFPYTQSAFVGMNGVITDLNNLIDPSLGLLLYEGLQINDSGQILALAQDTGGSGSVVLLTPIPEPASLTLLSTSSFFLLRRRSRCVR
jgi:hypothetical protein